jgi:hypothetical protein
MMSDSKLPQVRPQTLPESNNSPRSLAGINQSRLLFFSGLVVTGSAVGVFFLAHYIIASVLLVVLGVGFFGASQLVKKSLALTSSSQNLLLGDSPLHQLDEIRKQVSKCKFLEKVEREGTALSDQGVQLVQQYKNLQSALDSKFEPGELTYSRYSEGIFNSCMAIAENMLHAKSLLENLNVMNQSGSQDLWNQQKAQAVKIIESNSAALTELAALFNSVNDIVTKEKYRDQLENSMQQIRDLAERAKQYSKH